MADFILRARERCLSLPQDGALVLCKYLEASWESGTDDGTHTALFVLASYILKHKSHDLQYVCSLKAALGNLRGWKYGCFFPQTNICIFTTGFTKGNVGH